MPTQAFNAFFPKVQLSIASTVIFIHLVTTKVELKRSLFKLENTFLSTSSQAGFSYLTDEDRPENTH